MLPLRMFPADKQTMAKVVAVLIAVVAITFLTPASFSGSPRPDAPHPLRTEQSHVVMQPGEPGGRLDLRMHHWPVSLNPYVHSSQDLTSLLHGSLVAVNPVTKETELSLAKEMNIGKDKRRIIMSLREEVHFSDGEPLSAEDVVFTFNDMIFNPDNDLEPRQWMQIDEQYVIDRVERLDEHTVKFLLNVPLPAVLRSWLANMPILPAHKLDDVPPERHTETWTLDTPPSAVVGLGPYQLSSVSNRRMVLERNEFYWERDSQGTQLPYVDTLALHRNIRYFFDQNGNLATQPELDIVEWPVSFSERLIDDMPGFAQANGYKKHEAPATSNTTTLTFNQDIEDSDKRRLFRSTSFRRGIAFAVDQSRLVEAAPLGGVPRASTVNYYSPSKADDELPQYPHRSDTAMRLFQEAGVQVADDGKLRLESGEQVSFTLLVNAKHALESEVARSVASQLSELGLDVDVKEVDPAEFERRLYAKRRPDFEATVHSVPDDQLYPILHLSILHLHLHEPGHLYRRSDGDKSREELPPAQIKLLELAHEYRRVADRSEWISIQRKMQEVTAKDLSVIPLMASKYVYFAKKRLANVNNIEGWSPSLFHRLRYMWWQRRD